MFGFTFRLKPNTSSAALSGRLPLVVGRDCRDRLGGVRLETQDEVGRLRRRAGGARDGAVILAEDVEPRADVVGMAHRWGDAQRGAKIGGGNFGDLS